MSPQAPETRAAPVTCVQSVSSHSPAAKGILMERLKITSDEAFELLRLSSQRLNIKLRELASAVAETGQIS